MDADDIKDGILVVFLSACGLGMVYLGYLGIITGNRFLGVAVIIFSIVLFLYPTIYFCDLLWNVKYDIGEWRKERRKKELYEKHFFRLNEDEVIIHCVPYYDYLLAVIISNQDINIFQLEYSVRIVLDFPKRLKDKHINRMIPLNEISSRDIEYITKLLMEAFPKRKDEIKTKIVTSLLTE